jgi:hypothetical protein
MFSALLVWLWIALPIAGSQARMPAISFDSLSRDLGKVLQGEAIRQVFAFSNSGSGTLEIKGVEPS